ncbi:energy transducer TonB family protein [Dysgonomonas macrotermitis]|uniref:TonB family C-terminal domain-containing protein n=1 Tax=Dysgonomonas macrotermitis TaxID=1346286 RepID=A0A1M4YLK8_9BACT|nr:energy transducer TonB [Dysgonomonas macrotermitis]SHF06660.1 TonB family C-terminal domain-containing protein [Dysgonomonas macrotermitis]
MELDFLFYLYDRNSRFNVFMKILICILLFAYGCNFCIVSQDSGVDIFPDHCDMPQYVGGDEALSNFISKTLVYPVIANDSALVEGRVIARFYINEEGKASDIHIVKSQGYAFDEEVFRVLNLMPKWIPPKRFNKEKPFYLTIPIVFNLKK